MPTVALPAGRGDVYPADPDFPELEIASDPERMLEVFRTHLRPIGTKHFHIAACAPFRFRCRHSNARCVLQYTLRVVDPDDGQERDLWVTGILYAQDGEAQRLWEELRAEGPARGIPERWITFEPVSFVPELRMLVQVFPYDRKLPNLPVAMEDHTLRALEPWLLERLGPGAWRVEDRTVEPTRYRTELGAVLKHTIRARDAAARRASLRCYLKVYRSAQGAETFALLQSLLARASNAYAVAQPITYLRQPQVLALAEAPGAPLQQILSAEGADAATAARAVARAVAAFNQDDVGVRRTQSLAHQLNEVRRAATIVQWACPDTRGDVQAITDAVVGKLEEVPLVPIHRDLKPDHIFLDGNRVIFIDLDSVVLGDPARDPAHLFAHLAAGVGLDPLPRERSVAAATAFADEYFAHVPKTWHRRFPLHCAGALIEVAGSIFKRQEARWPTKVSAAVAEARARILLDEAARLADAAG